MKKLFMTLLVALGVFVSASASDEALNLKMKDGSVHSFILARKPVVTMGDGKLNVTTDAATATYNLYDVSEYTFGDATGIASVKTQTGFSRNGDNLVFHGVDTGKVRVYSLAGVAVRAEVCNDNGDAVVSLANLQRGVYIIKASGISIKINKK